MNKKYAIESSSALVKMIFKIKDIETGNTYEIAADVDHVNKKVYFPYDTEDLDCELLQKEILDHEQISITGMDFSDVFYEIKNAMNFKQVDNEQYRSS